MSSWLPIPFGYTQKKQAHGLTGPHSIRQLFSFKTLAFQGWQNGSASERACHQAQKPEFSSRNL